MKIHLTALGCRLNEAELEQWSQQFQNNGYQMTSQAKDADLVVFNTCAVTHEASRKSRTIINKLHRENPAAKLVVTGCHSTLNNESVAETLGVDLVVSNSEKNQLPDIARQVFALPEMPIGATEPGATALYSRGRHRAFIKIQDGCRYRCTFCIVTIARGEERSRPLREIITEIQNLHNQGINEAVLTGVHVGGYGSDTGSHLYELIKAILNDTDLPRLRLASVEPWDLPDHFFTLFENPRLMPHMHLPLQSGSDSVLRRMARRCRRDDFSRLVNKARSTIADFNITTDIIAGFPGETAQEWEESVEFIQTLPLGGLHIFPYSPRQGTKAASLPGQIDKKTKQIRCKQLAAINQQLKQQALENMSQKTVEILWEKPSLSDDQKQRIYTGYTPNYHRAEIHTDLNAEKLEYQITQTRLKGFDPQRLILTTHDS